MNESESRLEAQDYAHDLWLRIVNLLLVLLSLIILAMVFILVRKLRNKALPFHANLKVVPARVSLCRAIDGLTL